MSNKCKQKFNQSIAVITGAGSGIGRALTLKLAEYGANLAISDINQAGLEETVRLISNNTIKVHQQLLDVSNKQAMFDYAKTVYAELGPANLIVNNAGVALATGSFENTSLEDFEWLMGINFYGVVYGSKAFLPQLMQAEWGHIVNISSLFGIIGVPDQTAYNASKFAVRGMTEALRQELVLDGSTVSATSVHPGGIQTNIARNSRISEGLDAAAMDHIEQRVQQFDKVAKTTPESAAEQILNGVLKNKQRILIGFDAKLLDWVQRHMPVYYPKVLSKLFEWTTGSKRTI